MENSDIHRPSGTPPLILRIHPLDNVVVSARALFAGDQIQLDSGPLRIASDVSFGSKIATALIEAGASVIKYGEPIGFATATIAPGDHVHTHNLASRYFSPHLRGEPLARSNSTPRPSR